MEFVSIDRALPMIVREVNDMTTSFYSVSIDRSFVRFRFVIDRYKVCQVRERKAVWIMAAESDAVSKGCVDECRQPEIEEKIKVL